MSSHAEDNAFGRAFLEQICEWIATEMMPQDVFAEARLSDWAKANGYVKEE